METTQLTTADLANTANGSDREGRPEPVQSEAQTCEPLLARDVSDSMRTRWETIQTGFVDDPQASVKQADELVASTVQKLAQTFADERARLEQQWSREGDVSTEDLRQLLRRYRSFFQRLLSV